MQLKTVGESLNALNTINDILKPISDLENIPKRLYKSTTHELCEGLKDYSAEATKAAIAQTTLDETQIKSILESKKYSGALLETTTLELSQATAANRVAIAEAETTVATHGLGNAVQGLGAKLKGLAATHPALLAITAAIAGMYAASKIQNKFTNNSYANLESNISKIASKHNVQTQMIDSINEKLNENKERIKELLALDNPTYVDLQDLENLGIQNAILKENLELAKRAKEATNKTAIKELEKEFDAEYVTNDAKLEKRTKINSFKDVAINLLTAGQYTAYQSAKTQLESTKLEDLNNALEIMETLTELQDRVLKGETITAESVPDYISLLFGESGDIDIDTINSLIASYDSILESFNTELFSKLDELNEYDPNYESSYAQYLIHLIDETTKYLDFDTYMNSIIDRTVASNKNGFNKIGENIKENIGKGIRYTEADYKTAEKDMLSQFESQFATLTTIP